MVVFHISMELCRFYFFHSWYLVSWGLVQFLLVFLLILHLAPDHLICACFPTSPHLAPLSVTSLGFWSVLVDLSLLNLTIENIYLTKEQIDKLFICPWQWPSIVALTNNKKLCLKTMINRSQKITPDAIFTNTEFHLLSHPFRPSNICTLWCYLIINHHIIRRHIRPKICCTFQKEETQDL